MDFTNFLKAWIAGRAQPSYMETLWIFKNSIQQFDCTSPKPAADRAQPSCMETLWLFTNDVHNTQSKLWTSPCARLLVRFPHQTLLTLQIENPDSNASLGVMICLSQGGLYVLSECSCYYIEAVNVICELNGICIFSSTFTVPLYKLK